MNVIAYYYTAYGNEKLILTIPSSCLISSIWSIARKEECRFPRGILVRIEIVIQCGSIS